MAMNIFQEKGGWGLPSVKYKDNYGNKYTKEDGFFTSDEIDRRVKIGDLFIISEMEYYGITEEDLVNPLSTYPSNN